jgi:hypothetical protein
MNKDVQVKQSFLLVNDVEFVVESNDKSISSNGRALLLIPFINDTILRE